MTLRGWVFLIVMLRAGGATAQTPRPLVVGIDHIPVVVADLERAQADFRAMGFAIKPGRPHADGIRNAHVKFRDGTEIELITAPAAVDSLTAEYRAKLKRGDGPVYFGLYAPDSAALTAKLRASGVPLQPDGGSLGFAPGSPLHPLFFGGRNKSPTDRPEHFAHENSAVRLSAVWTGDTPERRALFRGLGVPVLAAGPCAAIGAGAGGVAVLPEGKVYLVPSARENVVAARVEVQRLDALESALRKNKIPARRGDSCDAGAEERSAVWVSPANAHGIWLEFVGPER